MARNSDGEAFGHTRDEIRNQSHRPVGSARTRDASAEASRNDRLARRQRLLLVKAGEIAQIEKAIQLYVDSAARWRDHGKSAMADSLDAKATVERERLTLAIAERDAWPPVI